jgi:hypothetical protein
MYPGMGGAAGAPGMGVPAAESSVEDPAARQADARATNALRTNVPISVDGVPLQEALAHVSDATGVDIVPDWKGLAQVDVRQDTPVSLQLRQGAAAEQVLSWLLRSAGGDAAGFALDHGAIIIAPRERLERLVVTRAYNLGDLAEQGRQLEALVRDTVAPNSWRENGGVGAVRFFNNRLFVTATEPNHRQVERLLGLMDAQGVRPGAAPGAAMPGLPGMGAPQAQPGGAPGVQPPGPSRRPLGLQPRR